MSFAQMQFISLVQKYTTGNVTFYYTKPLTRTGIMIVAGTGI